MGTVPSTENQAAEEVDQIIRSAVFSVVVKTVRADLIVQFPFLGWPIVSTLLDAMLSAFATRIYTRLAQVATFAVVDLQTDQEVADYRTAVIGLHVAQGSQDPEIKQRARERFEETLGRLIHFDGSATP